jgi:catechol 1,2-dioxygenase
MASLVKHLHAFAKEVELTQDEWDYGIDFLNRTGQICSAERQEFILLSDTLGFSMLVDAINNRRPTGATENTVFGPFHLDGAPMRERGSSISLDGKGESCLYEGRVIDLHGEPIEGAIVDVWSDNADGFYDVQQPGLQPKWNNRGRFVTGSDGSYSLVGIKPVSYPIPDDGPVGQMLGHLGRHPYRPAHMHYLVTAPGFQKVVTHTFVGGDPYLHALPRPAQSLARARRRSHADPRRLAPQVDGRLPVSQRAVEHGRDALQADLPHRHQRAPAELPDRLPPPRPEPDGDRPLRHRHRRQPRHPRRAGAVRPHRPQAGDADLGDRRDLLPDHAVTGAEPGKLFFYVFGTHFFSFALITLTVGPLSAEAVPAKLMATASGLVIGVGEIFGGGFAPIIAGFVAEHYGIQHMLQLTIGGLAVGLIVALSLKETAPVRIGAARPAH